MLARGLRDPLPAEPASRLNAILTAVHRPPAGPTARPAQARFATPYERCRGWALLLANRMSAAGLMT